MKALKTVVSESILDQSNLNTYEPVKIEFFFFLTVNPKLFCNWYNDQEFVLVNYLPVGGFFFKKKLLECVYVHVQYSSKFSDHQIHFQLIILMRKHLPLNIPGFLSNL